MYKTRAAQIYEERYLEAHNREHKALLWTQEQHAFIGKQTKTLEPYDYGHGVWMLRLTPTVRKLRQEDNSFKDPMAIVTKLRKEHEKKSLFIRLPISEESFRERENMILNDQVADLPSGSVRAIRLRLNNFKVFARSLEPKHALRLIRAIRCGVLTTKHEVDERTGELIPSVQSIYSCKNKRCAQPLCHAHHARRKKDTVAKAVKTIHDEAQRNNATVILVTLSTPWSLPSGERRLRRGTPIMQSIGRGGNSLKRPEPLDDSEQTSLLDLRVKAHEQHRAAFLNSKVTKRLLTGTGQWTQEVSFLTPSVPGHRTFPNPHSHIVTSLEAGTPPDAIAHSLTKTWQRVTGNKGAKVMVAIVDANEHEALSTYLDKDSTVTPDTEDTDNETPYSALVSSVVCDRSLSEMLAREDFGQRSVAHASFGYEQQTARKPINLYDFFHKQHLNEAAARKALLRKQQARDDRLRNVDFKLLDDYEFVDECTGARLLRKNVDDTSLVAHEMQQGVEAKGAEFTVADCQVLDSEHSGWVEEKVSHECACSELGSSEFGAGREGMRDSLTHSGNTDTSPETPYAEKYLIASGRLYDNSGSEGGQVRVTGSVAQAFVKPLTGLRRQVAKNLGLAHLDDRNRGGIVRVGNGQSYGHQSPSPTDRVQEYANDLFSSNQNVVLVHENLIKDAPVSRGQGHGSGECGWLRIGVESDDNLDSAHSVTR